MTSLAIIIKIILAISGFTTAFLSVFKRTIDDQKRLTKHGKISLACVCLTLAMAIGNEGLNSQKDARSAAQNKISTDRIVEIQKELNVSLAASKVDKEESKKRTEEAKEAAKRLEDMQVSMSSRIEDIDKHAIDPTVKRLVGELKVLSSKSMVMTGGKLSSVSDMSIDLHTDVNDVKNLILSNRSELAAIKIDVSNVRSEVNEVKKLVTPKKPEEKQDAGEDSEQ